MTEDEMVGCKSTWGTANKQISCSWTIEGGGIPKTDPEVAQIM